MIMKTIAPNSLNHYLKDKQKNPLISSDTSIPIGSEEEVLGLLSKCLINPSAEYPKPDEVISIGSNGKVTPVCTRQSISGIIGKAKGGKTALATLFAATVLNGSTGDGMVSLISKANGKVLFFDTEQSQHQASLTATRIAKIASDAHSDRLKYYSLRGQGPKTSLTLINAALKQEEDTALVIIDGGRDIVFDINNPSEATIVMTELLSLSSQYDIHICIVLHQNKGDTNARGHFGTELTNKSETVISVNKHPGKAGISIVKPDVTRGFSFDGFMVQRDENGNPYILDMPFGNGDTKDNLIEEIDDATHIEAIKSAFAEIQAKRYGEAWKSIQNQFHVMGKSIGDSKAKSLLSHYRQKGWIVKENHEKGYPSYKSSLPDEPV